MSIHGEKNTAIKRQKKREEKNVRTREIEKLAGGSLYPIRIAHCLFSRVK